MIAPVARCAAGCAALLLTGCGDADPRPVAAGDGVVSLDYCADQIVLGLVAPDRIRAVSPEAASDASFAAPRARGLRTIRPSLEEIAALRPRYAVRLYGGAPGIDRQLAALGITVVQLNFVPNIQGVAAEMRRVGRALDAMPRADRLARQFEGALAAAPPAPAPPSQASPAPVPGASGRPRLLYMTPGDVTTGADSFVGQVIVAAGFQTVRDAPGWGSLPVEAMVRRPPDAILTAFFDSARYRQDRWSASTHPRMRKVVAALPRADVPGSALACGNWLAGDALRALTALRRQLGPAT